MDHRLWPRGAQRGQATVPQYRGGGGAAERWQGAGGGRGPQGGRGLGGECALTFSPSCSSPSWSRATIFWMNSPGKERSGCLHPGPSELCCGQCSFPRALGGDLRPSLPRGADGWRSWGRAALGTQSVPRKASEAEGVRDSRPQSTVGRPGAAVMVSVSPAWPVMTQYGCEGSHHWRSFAPVVPTPAYPLPSPSALNNHGNDNDSK